MPTRFAVLAVSADLALLKWLKEALAPEYDISSVDDVLEAVDLLGTKHFALLLLELNLYVLDAIEFIRMIRADPTYRHLPIIAIADEPARSRRLNPPQVQAVVLKPLDAGDLKRRIQKIISRSA